VARSPLPGRRTGAGSDRAARLSRRHLLRAGLGLGLLLGACGRTVRYSQPQPGFLRYDADDVVAAFEQAGLPIAGLRPRPIATVTPNTDLPQQPRVRAGGPPIDPMTEVEALNFTIPGHGDRGGRIYIFDSAERLRAKQIWFARFPDLYPHVYPHQNVLLWLDAALPPAEIARYRAALETLP
jgi:hypothetical protein